MMLVAQFGPCAWEAIAREMPGRNLRQCRERWKHYLSVGFTERPWTNAEDNLLLMKHRELGPRWTKLSSFFQGRSDIQLKARWLKLTETPSAPRPPPSRPEHDVDVVRVKQPGMLIDQFAQLAEVEKEWDACFDIRDDSICRSGSEFSWF
jgi:hypothetical protein